MASMRVISADSHMMEPADLWETRLDSKFGDRAPKVVKNERGKGYLFVAPGVRPFPVAGGFGIGKSGEELKEQRHIPFGMNRPSFLMMCPLKMPGLSAFICLSCPCAAR